MDPQLEPLWRSGQKPFHGETLYPLNDVLVRDALVAIPSALRHIELYYPDAQLFMFDDWHQHDGFIVQARPVTLEALRKPMLTPESYVASLSDDFAVYRAIYPASLDFLLRYSVCDADASGQDPADREVHWTFTGRGHDVFEMRKRWFAYSLEAESSAEYFQERYSG